MELKEAASYFIDRISFEIEEPEERLEGAIRASEQYRSLQNIARDG